MTSAFGGQRSIQLSYECASAFSGPALMEQGRPKGKLCGLSDAGWDPS